MSGTEATFEMTAAIALAVARDNWKAVPAQAKEAFPGYELRLAALTKLADEVDRLKNQFKTLCPTCEGAGWDWKRCADEDLQVADPQDYYWCESCDTAGWIYP